MQCGHGSTGRSGLALAIMLAVGAWALPTHAARLEVISQPFSGDPIAVLVTFDDRAAGPGEILVEVEILGGQGGDLRAILLNLADDSRA